VQRHLLLDWLHAHERRPARAQLAKLDLRQVRAHRVLGGERRVAQPLDDRLVLALDLGEEVSA
jgi:hypothetical protein